MLMTENFEMDQIQKMEDVSKVEIRLEECQTEYEIFMSNDFAKWFEKVVNFYVEKYGKGDAEDVRGICKTLERMRNSEPIDELQKDKIMKLFEDSWFHTIANEFLRRLSAGKTNMAKMHKFMNLMLNDKGEFKMQYWQDYFRNITSDTLLKKDKLENVANRLEKENLQMDIPMGVESGPYVDAVKMIKDYGVMNFTMEWEERNFNPLFNVSRAKWDRVELADFLIAEGADMNLANKQGYSLSFATESRNKKIIEMLFAKGVEKHKSFGKDPKNQNDSLMLLLKGCRNHDDLNLVRYFLDNGWFFGKVTKQTWVWEDRYRNAAKEISKAADGIKGDDLAKKELRAIYNHVKDLIDIAIDKEKKDALERLKNKPLEKKVETHNHPTESVKSEVVLVPKDWVIDIGQTN